MRFVHSRDRQGRIRGGTYIVQEVADSPHPDLPDTVEPDTAIPDPVNPEALLTTEVDLRRTTTTTPTNTKESRSSCENENGAPKFAAWVPNELRQGAIEKVARLRPGEAQIVIDEWAGIMATGRIETSPLGYLHAMVSRLESGDFRLHYADAVAEMREQECNYDQLPGLMPDVITR
jgi:hypothetical protein